MVDTPRLAANVNAAHTIHMSLGQDIAPHLPFLRRYARALFGSQKYGDKYVRMTLESILQDHSMFDIYDLRKALYLTFQRIVELNYENDSDSLSGYEHVADARLGAIRPSERSALLLTQLEGFTAEDAGDILGIPPEIVEEHVQSAAKVIDNQTRANVLIIEDDAIVSADLAEIVAELGHRVASISASGEEAVRLAQRFRPGLILSDIRLAGNMDGKEAVKAILAEMSVPVVFITGYPEDLLTGERPEPTFLITKPFQRSTVKAAISQALFFDTTTAPDEPAPQRSEEPPESRAALVRAVRRLTPVPVAIREGRLIPGSVSEANTVLPEELLDALREDHLETVARLAIFFEGSNAGRAVSARLVALARTLATQINSSIAIRLASQVRGLRAICPAIKEVVDDVCYCDLQALLSDLSLLTEQFPEWLTFLAEARQDQLPVEGQQAVRTISETLQRQPDAVAATEVTKALADISVGKPGENDPAEALAESRSVGGILAKITTYVRERQRGIAKHFNNELDEAVGKGIANLLIDLSSTGALAAITILAGYSSFSWLTLLLPILRRMAKGRQK